MAAADLRQAAGLAFIKMEPRALAGTLGANLISFCEGFKASFSDQAALDHPVLNWVSVIEALATQAGALLLQYNANADGGGVTWLTVMPYAVFQQSASAVYRLCWVANNMFFAGQITLVQLNAILASYNAHIF
jgi:hypothetical protein